MRQRLGSIAISGNPSVQLVPADLSTPRDRAAIINAAYADYFVPTVLSESQVRRMDAIYDADLAHSVVARVGKELVGMAILSRRGVRGWVSSVGVIPGWRRHGIARAMMDRLITTAASLGLEQLTLEVIDRNVEALRLYESFGFYVRRELLTWRRPADAGPLLALDGRGRLADARRLLREHPDWQDRPPCWQRDRATLTKMTEGLEGLVVDRPGGAGEAPPLWDWLRRGEAPSIWGYVVFSDMGDRLALLEVGLDPEGDPSRAGRVLLQVLGQSHAGKSFSIGNVAADDRLNRVLSALGFEVTLRQLEMRRELQLSGCER